MRIAKLDKVLDRISRGRISRGEAAGQLEVSERTVNRVMKRHGIERPVSQAQLRRKVTAEAARDRRAELEAVAGRVLYRRLTAEEAARLSGVSLRTMFRWVSRVKSTKKARK